MRKCFQILALVGSLIVCSHMASETYAWFGPCYYCSPGMSDEGPCPGGCTLTPKPTDWKCDGMAPAISSVCQGPAQNTVCHNGQFACGNMVRCIDGTYTTNPPTSCNALTFSCFQQGDPTCGP